MFKELIGKISRLISENTLYYPGCLAQYASTEIYSNYKEILKKLNIDFIEFTKDFLCCGGPAKSAGYIKDFEFHKQKFLKLLKERGVSRIITICPSCYATLKNDYKLENVEFITSVILENLSEFRTIKQGDITYHDPCHLGRYSGIYDEPRKILRHLGYNVKELKDNKEKSMCCGAGGGLRNNNKELSDKIAKMRLSQVKTNSLVTTCPMCYEHFKENSKDIQIFELSQFLKEALPKNEKIQS